MIWELFFFFDVFKAKGSRHFGGKCNLFHLYLNFAFKCFLVLGTRDIEMSEIWPLLR